MQYQMVYVSKRTPACPDEELPAILAVARRNNQALGVTGMLLCTSMLFMQMLEGEEGKVSALYESIAGDPRHRDCLVVHRGTSAERSFADWSMGMQDFSGENPYSELPGVNRFLQDPEPWRRAGAPGVALDVMLQFQDLWKVA